MKNIRDKIRVMHIVNDLDEGGLETVLAEMLPLFDRKRFVSYTCCVGEKGALAAVLEKNGVGVFFVPKKNKMDFFRIFRLAKLLKDKKIDIVHSYSGVYRDGAIAAKLAKVPVIIHTDQGRFYPDTLMSKFYHRFLTNLFRNKVTAVSEDLRSYMTREVGLDPDKVIVIPNGVKVDNESRDFDRLAYRRKVGLSGDDLVFGIVARLVPVKDHETLLKASVRVFNEIPNAKLLIIGDGPLRDCLERKAKELNIADKVVFLGRRWDIPELLSILDLFVLSSRHEGTSLSILEAMAKGLAVIATNIGGNPKVVDNDITGMLVEPGNPDSLASSIIELLKDRKKRTEFGIRGKEKVRKEFGLENIVRQYEELYNSYFAEENHKIKVLLLASNPEWAGAEVHVAALADNLKKDNRVEVSVCVFHNGKLVDYLAERGIRVKVVRLKWIFDPSSIAMIRRILKDGRIDILHTHGYKANVIGSLAAWHSKRTVCIRTEHGLGEPFHGFDRLKMSLYKYLDYLTGRFLTKKIISVSSEISEKASIKYPERKIATIHNGIDSLEPLATNKEKLKQELGIARGKFVIGIIGRLTPVKGHEYFINAAKLILGDRHDICFLIVGEGPLRARLESMVPAKWSEYIKFTGFRDDVKDVTGIMDIVIFSSLSEGIPYALLEAMLQKKAIIAAKVGGLTEVLSDGINGLLIKSRDEKAIAEKCLYLLGHNEVRRSIGEEAEKTVISDFSAESMKEGTIRVYEECLAGSSGER